MSSLGAQLGHLARRLGQSHPCIPIAPERVTLLNSPVAFHDKLLNMIQNAKSRVFLSSLYLGGGAQELISSLRRGLESNSSLKVQIHLDFLRSTRPGDTESLRRLAGIVRDFPDRMTVSLFRSPKLKGLLSRVVPPRFDEGWGTWHAKMYGVDDQVLLSGANLSKSYFTNRQDRYIHFSAAQPLADYSLAYLDGFRSLSYSLRPSDEPSGFGTSWSNQQVHPQHIEDDLRSHLTSLRRDFQQKYEALGENSDTCLIPSAQAGYASVRDEEQVVQALIEHAERNSTDVDLTSGYFGLYKGYQQLILNGQANCRIVAAGPLANGFYGSSGVSGHIPTGYTLLEQRFWRKLRAAGRAWTGSKGVRLYEWHKPDWTYHAKGIWLSPAGSSLPYGTLFGSTNLSSRSAHLDTELSFVLLTGDEPLRASLRDEISRMHTASTQVDEQTWATQDRAVGLKTKLLVALFGEML
ncbi:hypothetical protein BKA62DRAFT_683836 [Auriculariales sp. MPI-PUGE-AT-0066]|nr:hypothetical protein BKA62DRAFT_683836 [Auriculariales sp. MPI-PUGE-AT-0066]